MSLHVVETAQGGDGGSWSQEGLIVHGAEQATGGSVDSAILHPIVCGECSSSDHVLTCFIESAAQLGQLCEITLHP